jgi:hypothetical protein
MRPARSGLIIAAIGGSLLVDLAQAQSPPPSKVDWSKIAELVVKRTLKLAPGERVILFWDQTSDRGAAPALRTAILGAGGVVSAEMAAPTGADLAAIRQLPPATQAAQLARRDSIWAEAFSKADAAIWLPTPLAGLSDRPFEHLVERSKVRSIHFHWFLPPDPADVDKVDALYAAAISVPPERLQARITAVEAALRGATVRITSPNGTNLVLKVAPNAWVHRNTGDASRAKIATARSVRDRQEELPGSVYRTTDISGAEGTIVGYASFDTRAPILSVTFTKNRVSKIESKRGAETIITNWNQATGDKEVPSELVIGTNPELPSLLPSGFMPYYGYGAGVVRLAFGDNWESGGKNRASNGETLLFIPDATVAVNGKAIVKDGKLVVGGR